MVFTNADDSTAQVSNHKQHHDQIRVMYCYVFDENSYEFTFNFQTLGWNNVFFRCCVRHEEQYNVSRVYQASESNQHAFSFHSCLFRGYGITGDILLDAGDPNYTMNCFLDMRVYLSIIALIVRVL